MIRRDSIPQYGMTAIGQSDLNLQGVVVLPFMESVRMDPDRLRPHYHEFFQIFVLQGEAQVMHDFQEFRSTGDTLVFLSPGQVHTVLPGPGLGGITLSFSQEFFDLRSTPPSTLYDFPFFFSTDVATHLQIPEGDPDEILPMIPILQREFDAALPDAAEALRAALRLFLVRVNRLYSRTHPPRKAASRAGQLVRQFHLEVEQRFKELTSVGAYATALGVSSNHLNDVVHEQTGRPAGDIIRQRRLLDAKRLLLHSDLSVSEIGYDLGFHDPSYFSRFFRRYAGVPPEAFRDTIREKYH
ncbi:MAG TPA: helix-turn-helix domain-containing protein [Verrucomicrobium sp.]|nr:helix-turn-helix domain-containing protein [Verrucomicrobium sp.]